MTSRKVTTVMTKDHDINNTDNTKIPIKVVDRPTFILKTREGENRAVSPNQRNGAKKEAEGQAATSSKLIECNLLSSCIEMTKCKKFMDEDLLVGDNLSDYLIEQQDFLVVGVLGTQGVGKSTILSLLASKNDIFSVQNATHHKSGSNCTTGIDFYVTKNRVIYLDTQPILSSSMMTSTSSMLPEFINADYNLELKSLEFTAFLYSVCHIIIFVQDWFVDPNLVRFLQTAEMLKPSSTSNLNQDYVEYYPHILFLHNKAELQDLMPDNLETMKDFYDKVFANSRLQTHSGLDMNPCSTEGQLNLFLIPRINSQGDESIIHSNEKELIEKLRSKIHGIPRNPMTPSTLTEKTWYHYATKALEGIRNSHFCREYGRLMP
ncbi:hypothetical protein PV325_005667 [Microctonus aethiopoides]|nr:hypothetical protein PV325_005667 [Microctonus aethiopoides]KAK0097257.1 hypothetical protein PV326_002743 [Microctonus aethiopoides]